MESKTKNKKTLQSVERIAKRAFDGSGLAAGDDAISELKQGWFNAAYAVHLADNREVILNIASPQDAERMLYEQNIMRTEVDTMRLVAMASSWDPLVPEKSQTIAAREARAAFDDAKTDLEDAQTSKTINVAPSDGVVLTHNLEVGETAAPAGVVMEIDQWEEVELAVYIPETKWGKVQLGDQISLTVDSSPNEIFTGTVAHISQQTEFPPRTVQTLDGRRATVYAIKLIVPNPDLKQKPGMPAEAVFLLR